MFVHRSLHVNLLQSDMLGRYGQSEWQIALFTKRRLGKNLV